LKAKGEVTEKEEPFGENVYCTFLSVKKQKKQRETFERKYRMKAR